jgi:hypothetical protein
MTRQRMLSKKAVVTLGQQMMDSTVAEEDKWLGSDVQTVILGSVIAPEVQSH